MRSRASTKASDVLRHGQVQTGEPRTDDERLIAENVNAPLSECPYGSWFADDDPAHPCHAECLEECS